MLPLSSQTGCISRCLRIYWYGSTAMSGIISNPKYKGYYVGNKVRIVDMFTKKQKFLPPEEWVMFN